MSDADDRDDFEELLLLEDILISDEEKETAGHCSDTSECKSPVLTFLPSITSAAGEDTSSDEEAEPAILEEHAAEYRETLSLNNKLIRCLLNYKRHVTVLLKKCERKLELVEARLNGNSISSAKLLTCNAGQPYFKDKTFFCAASNEDELRKESRGEIQIDNLPKVFGWSAKDRNTLLKAIRLEAVTNAFKEEEEDEVELFETLKAGEKHQGFLPKNFREMVGPLGAREFDWFKIAVTYFEEKHSPVDCRVMWNVFLHPDINKGSWKKSEDNRLKEVAREYRYEDWDSIAQKLGTQRTAYQCFVRYNTTRKMPMVRNCVWSAVEDEQLVRLIEAFRIGDYVPWGDIAGWMHDRTKQQVYFRWTYSLAPYLVKGRFTKKEDNALKEAVSRYGKNFCKISAALMPNRSTIQLNDRYTRLAVKTNRRAWTLSDDVELLELYDTFGSNWSRIAKELETRTRTQIRHRYATIQRSASRRQAIAQYRMEIKRDCEPSPTDEKAGSNSQSQFQEQFPAEFRECEFTDEVDFQLFEFFRNERIGKKSPKKQEDRCYNSEELLYITKQVHNVLRTLNAKVNIPEDLSQFGLSERERQLYSSVREYIKERNDLQKRNEIVESCSLRMFGPQRNKAETSHFVPPLAFDTYVRRRKMKKGNNIDCRMNGVRNYLVERPTTLETPDIVVTSVGGDEQDAQFEKISKLLQRNCHSRPNRGCKLIRKVCVLCPQIQSHQIGVEPAIGNDQLSRFNCPYAIMMPKTESREGNANIGESSIDVTEEETATHATSSMNLLMEDLSHRPSVPYVDVPMEEQHIQCIEPSYGTLLAFKKLKYLRNVMDRIHPVNEQESDDPESQIDGSQECQELYSLLETRLEQLFKYPLALSKTTLPQFHGSDTFFSPESAIAKRKRSSQLHHSSTKRQKE